jgi:hypothetical protein
MNKSLEPISPWVQRLLQMQLTYVYLDTVYLKLAGPGWLDGTAMYYALNYLELRRFNLRFLFYNLWLIKISTYGTLLAESSVPIFIWFRKSRYWMMGAALVLHEGINLTMQFPVFQYVMMSSVLIFIYPKDSESLVSNILKLFRKIPGLRPSKFELVQGR